MSAMGRNESPANGCSPSNSGALPGRVISAPFQPQAMAPRGFTQNIADPGRYQSMIEAAGIAKRANVPLEYLDIGGGYPAEYGDPVPPIGAFFSVIKWFTKQIYRFLQQNIDLFSSVVVRLFPWSAALCFLDFF